jgi:hypothetical protein
VPRRLMSTSGAGRVKCRLVITKDARRKQIRVNQIYSEV